jgi:hypothetical protein
MVVIHPPRVDPSRGAPGLHSSLDGVARTPRVWRTWFPKPAAMSVSGWPWCWYATTFGPAASGGPGSGSLPVSGSGERFLQAPVRCAVQQTGRGVRWFTAMNRYGDLRRAVSASTLLDGSPMRTEPACAETGGGRPCHRPRSGTGPRGSLRPRVRDAPGGTALL